MIDFILNHLSLHDLPAWREGLFLLWFFVVIFWRGVLHSWHWATKKGPINQRAGKFIRYYGEPHFSITFVSFFMYAALYILGVHLLALLGTVLLTWAIFDGLIDLGAGKSFFSKHVTREWSLWIAGRKIISIPNNPLPKLVRIILGASAVVVRFVWL